MTRDLPVKKLSPEEKELGLKEEELKRFQDDLVQKELELSTLHQELADFTARYTSAVGESYARLDRLKYCIADLLERHDPTENAAKLSAKYRSRAENSERESKQVPKMVAESFAPKSSTKDIFRKLVRLVHPDLVVELEERSKRNQMMSEINQAYCRGDEERLQQILQEVQTNAGVVETGDIGARLVLLIRRIHQVRERIGKIELEVVELKSSDAFHLFCESENSEQQGRNLFQDLTGAASSEYKSVLQQLRDILAD